MPDFLRELSQAVRGLRKHPRLVAVAVFSIALGMSVNATVFSWIENVLLEPLPGVREGSRLLAVKTLAASGELLDSSYLDYLEIGRTARSFTGVTAFRMQPLYLSEGTRQSRVWAETVAGNFFDVLGVKPLHGRTFNEQEQAERPGGAPVVVLGEVFWRSHFNADPGVVGRVVRLNRQSLTVVGIVPAAFEGGLPGLRFDLYVPLTMAPLLNGTSNWLGERSSRPLMMFARLAPGVSRNEANSELATIGARLSSAFPRSNHGLSFHSSTIADSKDGVQRILGQLLQVLFVLGIGVIVIVCANVGNLLVARSLDRQREFAIRVSLGAGRMHLITQLLAEAFLLTLAGGTIGLFLASWMAGGIRALIPPTDLPISQLDRGFSLNGALFTAGLAFVVTMLCAAIPAWTVLRGQVSGMREGGRSGSASARTRRLRGALVMAEIGLATVALVGCGLFLQSFRNAREANPGFRPDGILLAGLDLTQTGYTREEGRASVRRLLSTLNSTPGIRSAALAEDIPLGFNGGSWEAIEVDGYVPGTADNMKIWRDVVSPGYFGTMQMRLVEGRDFNDQDRRETPTVAVINETFARRFLPPGPAVGRKFRGWGREITIVGVVQDSRIRTLDEAPLPYFYVPVDQFFRPGMAFGVLVRTEGAPERFDNAVRSAIASTDPNLTVTATLRFVDFIGAAYVTQKIGANVLTAVGGLCLLLAMAGLYATMLHAVSARTHEIGIRMAVGASPANILRQVIREGAVLSAAGVAAGLVLTVAGARYVSSLLYGVQAVDPLTIAGAAVCLIACGVVSAWLPAWRAAHVNPISALRQD